MLRGAKEPVTGGAWQALAKREPAAEILSVAEEPVTTLRGNSSRSRLQCRLWSQPAVLRGVVVRMLKNIACGQDDSAHVAGGTAIRGAGSQSLTPQSLVSQSVSAHDANAHEFFSQPLHVV